MVMTQWYDILGVIAAIFAGFSAMLVLVVYLEQWLAQPDRPLLASADEQALDEPDRAGMEQWAPDPSMPASAPYPLRAIAPGVGLDRTAAPVSGHPFTVLPPHLAQQ